MAPEPDSPSAAAAALFAAEDVGNVPAMLALIDPEAMDGFKTMQLAWQAMEERRRARMARSPNLASAESSRRTLIDLVFKARNRGDLEALSAEELLRRWLSFTHRPGMAHPVEASRSTRVRRVVGEVYEQADLAHVVFTEETRKVPPPPPIEPPSTVRLITVRRTPAGWRTHLNGGIIYNDTGGFSIAWISDAEGTSSGA